MKRSQQKAMFAKMRAISPHTTQNTERYYTVRAHKKGEVIFESTGFKRKEALELAKDIKNRKRTTGGSWAKDSKISLKLIGKPEYVKQCDYASNDRKAKRLYQKGYSLEEISKKVPIGKYHLDRLFFEGKLRGKQR